MALKRSGDEPSARKESDDNHTSREKELMINITLVSREVISLMFVKRACLSCGGSDDKNTFCRGNELNARKESDAKHASRKESGNKSPPISSPLDHHDLASPDP